MDIITSIHGRKLGLGPLGELVVNRSNNQQEVFGQSATVLVTSAQVLALFATPITVVAAPAAGYAIVPFRWAVYKPAGTAYGGIAAGEDLVMKWTGAAGAQATSVIETTGFLDQATAQTRFAHAPASTGATAGDVNAVAAAPLVVHLLVGEITTGTSDLYVRVWYDVCKTAFGLTD